MSGHQKYSDKIVGVVNKAIKVYPIAAHDITRALAFAEQLSLDKIDDEILDACVAEYVKTIYTEINPTR